MTKRAPWTDEQVKRLEAYQKDGRFHPFTCPGDRADCAHRRELIPTPEGWECQCGRYTQDWAHDFMLGPPPSAAGWIR